MAFKVIISVTDGPNAGASHEFSDGDAVIGRGRCHLSLRDRKVSAQHCRVFIKGNEVYIEDLQSTNGTFFEGSKIDHPRLVQNLDEFVLGLSRLSIAIVDDLIESTNKNSEISHHETSDSPFPTAEGLYRETGIHRIENLIQDEMATLSKWDHPEVKESSHSKREIITQIKVTLKRMKGPEGLSTFVCTKPITTIGRRGVDIKLNDLDCSRIHAQIEIVGGKKAYLKDLASTNGSFSNGKRVSTEEIRHGDVIQVGQTVFEVIIEGQSD